MGNYGSVQSGYDMPQFVGMHILFADPYAAVTTTSSSLAFRGRDLQGDRNLAIAVHWAFANMQNSYKEWI